MKIEARDKIKDREYFKETYDFYLNAYKEYLEEIKIHNLDGIAEERLIRYYYGIFLYGFKTFYAGYSLGMAIKDLKPIGEGLICGLSKKFQWERGNFEDVRSTLIFAIILNIRNEYVTKFIKLLREYELKDRYIDHLINYIDETEEIKAKEVMFKKREKTVMEIVELAKEGKKEEAVKLLKKYLTKEWYNLQDDQVVVMKGSHLRSSGSYVGYWCMEAAALVKMYDLDDSSLLECDYYPAELAHFEG